MILSLMWMKGKGEQFVRKYTDRFRYIFKYKIKPVIVWYEFTTFKDHNVFLVRLALLISFFKYSCMILSAEIDGGNETLCLIVKDVFIKRKQINWMRIKFT